jgi:hypothetical protein
MLPRSYLVYTVLYTDKKENNIFLIYKEIQNGAVVNSYITNALLIYGEILSHFLLSVLRIRIRIRIRIHRINEFLGLLDPDPDPLVRGMDPDPDPDHSIIKKNGKKNLDFYCFVTSF